MNRRLLIVDRYDAVELRDVIDGRHPGAPWDILLLGLSNAWFLWAHAPSRDAQVNWRLIDPAPHAAAASERAGQFLVDLVERLPRTDLGAQTLGDLFASPEGSLWWFLEIAEKGPLRGPLVSQLYRLAITRSVVEQGAYDEVRVGTAESWLASAFQTAPASVAGLTVRGPSDPPMSPWWSRRPMVRYALHAAVAIIRLLAIKLFLLWLGRADVKDLRATGVASFTFYPVWWAKPFTPEASDRFLSHAGEAGVSGYLAWLTSPLALWRNRGQVAELIRVRRLVPLQSYVRLSDLAAVLSPWWFARIGRVERGLRARLHEAFAGFEVGPLIADEVIRSLTGTELLLDIQLSRAVRRCVAECAPRTVLYRLEFQPSENALLRGLRGRSRAVGFLHYPFGHHYLSTRFASGEMARHLRGAVDGTGRPMPDGIVACGSVGVEHATASGYPQDRCAVCGPQRFGRLLEYRDRAASRMAARAKLGLPAHAPIYFVTLAITERDTEALFGALAGAVEAESGYHLIIRPHPNRPHGDDALADVLRRLGPEHASLMPPQHDVYDVMRASDALVCIGSMIAFEAIALDRMPVVFENPSSFPALSLAEFSDGLFIAHDQDGMRRALAAIATQSEEVADKKQCWPGLLRRVLGDLDTPLPAQLSLALSRLEPPR